MLGLREWSVEKISFKQAFKTEFEKFYAVNKTYVWFKAVAWLVHLGLQTDGSVIPGQFAPFVFPADE